MKNIFKLMGIALMASSMLFVACSDDDDEVTNNPEVADGVTVNFGGKSWNAASTSVLVIEDQVRFLAYQEAGRYDNFLAQFRYDKERKYTGTIKVADNGDLPGGYSDERIEAVKYYTEDFEGENGTDADWWAKEITIEVTRFDEDNMMFSATINGTMFSYKEWYEDEYETEPTIDEVSNKSLKATAKNISLVKNDVE